MHRKMHRKMHRARWAGVLIWMGIARTGASMPIDDQTYRQLESDSAQTRDTAIAKVLAERRADVKKIADLFVKYHADDHRKGTAKDAMLLLGKLRAAEYVPLLVENLTFQVFYLETNRPQTTEDLYPAVKALIEIGSPAASPVLERLKKEDGEALERTGATVLRDVLGAKWAVAVLEFEIANAAPGLVPARLRQVLQTLKTLPN
jgi:HEAT repeat protein